MITANKGGWAELYISAVGVREGFIPLIDEGMNEIEGAGVEVLGVRREGSDLTCWRNFREGTIDLTDARGVTIRATPLDRFGRDTRRLLSDIEQGQGPSFGSEAGRRAMRALGYTQVQAGTRRKADLEFILRNQRTGRRENARFSAKSIFSSSMPTILNSSAATTVRMAVRGLDWRRAKMAEKMASGPIGRVKAVRQLGGDIFPHSFLDPVFHENLRMVDEVCPVLFLEIARQYARGEVPRFSFLVDALMRNAKIVRRYKLTKPLVVDKICRLLAAAALGMTPGTLWDGTHAANGGMLILDNSGRVCLLDFADRDHLHRFLLSSTKLDCPSPNRLPSGTMVRIGEQVMMDFNFQIRWASQDQQRES